MSTITALHDLEPRCESLLDDLQRARGDWLPLGEVRTVRSPEVYLRAGCLGQWELYVRQDDGSFELGPWPDDVRFFARDGDFRSRVRAHPGLRAEPIAAAFAPRIAALDASARECFAALESGSITLTDAQGTQGRFDDAFWLLESSRGAANSIVRLQRELVMRRLWEALFTGTESKRGDVASWLETARALLDPEALFARVMACGATVSMDREPFQKIYRRADGQLVMLVPSGETVEGFYPGDGYTCEAVDAEEYVERACSEEALRDAVSFREILGVRVGVPEETGGRAVW